MSPNAADWATTDHNFEWLSLIMKGLEQHHHTGTDAMLFPGANPGDPTNPTLPTLTTSAVGGIMTPGTTVGVRLSYTDGSGLETDASPEQDVSMPTAILPPSAPTQVGTPTPLSSALGGGTYIYALTKTNGTGETTISDTLPIQVFYDQTYSVQIQFNAISTYTDGTTGINIYRSAGQSAAFQLVGQITTTSQTTFTDTNTISPGNQNVVPPATSTFNATYKVHIDWAALTFPDDAAFINVFVTRQAGIWGTNCLLSQLPITILTPPTEIDYLGNEALGVGTPSNGSRMVNSPPKIDLSTESNLGTIDLDFNGHQAKNLVLDNTTSALTTNGIIYYDTSIKNVRARINGAWVSWGTTTASAYTHPSQESGGHIAANIPHSASSGVSLKTILDRIADSTTGAAKQVVTVVQATPSTTAPVTASTSPVTVPEMSVTFTPKFNNQWGEINAWLVLSGDTSGMVVNYAWSYVLGGGSPTTTSPRVATLVGQYVTGMISDLYQFPTGTTTITLQWWVNTGTVTNTGLSRGLTIKGLF